MKAQCERCEQIVELAFTAAPGGIDVACSSCGARYFVTAGAPPPGDEQDEPPAAAAPVAAGPPGPPVAKPAPGEQECPKCGLVQPRAEACRRCGLVFVRWKGAAAEAATASAEADAQRREAVALWAACEGGWGDDARHDAFLAFCQRTDQFPYAAGRYRAAQTARGAAAEPAAARSLARIEKLAITALELSSRRASAVATGPLPYRRALLLLGAVLLLLVGGLLWAIFHQGRPSRGGGEVQERVVPVSPARRK